jgi:hypothetical protein
MVLRVILQIVPFGDEDRVREIGRLDVFNKGRVNDACEYGVIDLSPGKEGLFTGTATHRRNDGAWALLHTILGELPVEGP